ncbi:DUF3592 domain-containing protein [Cellulomonas sp. Root485]|uniref:DUF2510 domain-containing protein n=1 Tax=Cellulomonas sp. Root485 TaxID=1736546 RepID=UPI000B21D0FB|nr:DUF3592 domain-containing protein [Cellulomonas sp. Root485]
MTTPPPGWYPSPDAAGMRRWWDGTRWTAHVRTAMSDAPAPVPTVAMPSEYAAAFEATAVLQQRGGLAGAIGGLGQQFLSTALAQATPATHAGGGVVPQPHAAADPAGTLQPYGSVVESPDGAPDQVQGMAEVFEGIAGGRRGAGVGNGLKLIVIGLVFALSGFFVVPQITSARAGAGETTISGTVVDLHESTDDEGSRLCSPEATFSVDGATYGAQAGYSSSSCPSIGSSITVIYPTADPTDARIPTSVGFLLLLGIFPVIGVALLVLGIRGLVVGSSSITSGLRRLRS